MSTDRARPRFSSSSGVVGCVRQNILVAAKIEIACHGAVIADQLLQFKTGARIFEACLGREFFDFEEGEDFFAKIAGFEGDCFVKGEDVHE